DVAAELDTAAAERRRHVVQPDPAGIEVNRAVDRVERVRDREVAQPAAGDRRAAGEVRLRQRTVDRRGQGRTPGAADVAEKPLQDPQARVTGRLQRDPVLIQVDRAGDAQLRVLADHLKVVD